MTDLVETAATTAPPKKGAILGTANTWKLCPFADASLDVFGLNDGYILGVPRATAWFDVHPVSEMVFRTERRVVADTVPAGAYLRPAGHLEWLKSRPFPVFMQQAPAGWPNAQAFPFDAIRAKYGDYFSSTPAWMLCWMLEQGYTEIHIYGIHLATEWEYIQQRPNMEFLIGMALAKGVQFVIPDRSTLLKGRHLYALEPKPTLALDRVLTRIQTMKERGRQIRQAITALPRYRRLAAADLRRRLQVLDVELADARQESARLQALAAVA